MESTVATTAPASGLEERGGIGKMTGMFDRCLQRVLAPFSVNSFFRVSVFNLCNFRCVYKVLGAILTGVIIARCYCMVFASRF